jgi:ferritin
MLMGEIRQEVTTSLGTVKKEAQLAQKKRDEDGRSLRNDFEVAHVKSVKEMGSIQDKLQRLAAQFDKELMARDKQMKQYKNMSQEDMQRAV